MGIFKGLNKEDKDAIGLLRFGTFLENFDLMLYIHMAVVLNDLFFPPSDHHLTPYLSAALFSSTFILRPVGALVFGWIGDNYGRKTTVMITMFMMASTCFIVANLSTYAEIGITATWMIVICRMVQGVSSLGEVVGAELYLMETLKPPHQYPAVAFVTLSAVSGSLVALGSSALCLGFTNLNWRVAFWFGCAVGFAGSIARIKLRESGEFVREKERHALKSSLKESSKKDLDNPKRAFWENKNNIFKTGFIFFMMQLSFPISFYFSFVYCPGLLKEFYHYSPLGIMSHSFIATLAVFVSYFVIAKLSYKMDPFKILKFKAALFPVVTLLCPFALSYLAPSGFDPSGGNPVTGGALMILMIQSIAVVVSLDTIPATPIFFSYFPTLQRFTYVSVTYALSRALTYPITAFGMIYLSNTFGHFGWWVLFIPTFAVFAYGLRYFLDLEKDFGDHSFGQEDDHPLEKTKKWAAL